MAFRRTPTNGESTVAVVGDFNDWSPRTDQMSKHGGDWTLTVSMPPRRRYRFRYLLDGQLWENDWAADDCADNPYGGHDSVIDLSASGGYH